MKRVLSALGCAAGMGLVLMAATRPGTIRTAQAQLPHEFVNSVGMKMILIPAGRFRMGDLQPAEKASPTRFLLPDDANERPAHEVTISHPFYISETEVTATQYQKFRMDYEDAGRFPPYVSGVSWYDARAFTRWLSKKEHRSYRLPTEAEWEYACRAGSSTPYSSGNQPPAPGQANAWGVKNMESEAPEWVLDWYGHYSGSPQTDPVGPASGFARVVRGGGIMAARRHPRFDTLGAFYRRCANRASVAPVYHGQEPIGFRVVMAAKPATAPLPVRLPLFRKFVIPARDLPVKAAPDPHRPWFRYRDLLPTPPEDASPLEIAAAGLPPDLHGHNHSPGLVVCPNGDVLAIYFSSSTASTEYLPNTSFIGTRLRFGSNEWDPPGLFYDFADVNEQSALLWNDRGTVTFFGGGIGLADVPFRWMTSADNGAEWSAIHFPTLVGRVGGFSPQPITSAFRGPGGHTIYLATDAVGATSLLWASHDNGRTWQDTGGRTGGRHTAFVVLKDGGILGMGGKNSNIDGYMPESISHDGGRTWTIHKSPFPALGSNQRPTILRLSDDNLFFASDFQDRKGRKPAAVTRSGAFVALSRDDGRTWTIKPLPGARAHEAFYLHRRGDWHEKNYGGFATLGYTVAAQAPNGLIYLITSMNHPAQEFEMNEAWILSSDTSQTSSETASGRLVRGHLNYPSGTPEATWSGRIEPDGRYLLDGPETWYFSNGRKEYHVTWHRGDKVGKETLWRRNGTPAWQWDHRAHGLGVWTHFWPNGKPRQQSTWQGDVCSGPAALWDEDGHTVARYVFKDGEIQP